MQTKRQSIIESLVNISIGYSVAIFSQLLIFPLFDIHLPLHDNLLIGAYFTLISLVRSYLVRRLFNRQSASTLAEARKIKQAVQ